jgi:hypothetical protein
MYGLLCLNERKYISNPFKRGQLNLHNNNNPTTPNNPKQPPTTPNNPIPW